MHKDDIKPGDVLCNTDKNGTGYYRVIAVQKVLVKVESETGAVMRAYPHWFDRKVAEHPHFWHQPSWGGVEQCRVCGEPSRSPSLGTGWCSGPVPFAPLNGIEQMEG